MPLAINVVWGDRWGNEQRLTPALLNRIFEQATFQLQGTIDAASAPPGGIDSSWMGSTFVSGLAAATPVNADYLLGHDTSAGAPKKFLVSDVLGIGFAAAAAVTTLAEADEFTVLVGGMMKKIAMPLVRTELLDPPNALTWTTVAFATDRVLIYDTDATEAKRVTPADLVRSVTDRVLTTAGSGTAYTVTTGLSLAALATGIRLIVRLHASFVVGATLSADGLTAKALRTADDGAIGTGVLATNRIVELVYDATAAGGAGGWLVQGVLGGGITRAQFEGQTPHVSLTVASNPGGGDATLFNCPAHGRASGEVVWFETTQSGLVRMTPYYVIAVNSANFRLGVTKSLALAGTALTTTGGTTSHTMYAWSADPLGAALNVDGIIKINPGSLAGRFYLDFEVAQPTAYYPVQVTGSRGGSGGCENASVDTGYAAKTEEGFGFSTWGNTSDYGNGSTSILVV